MKKNTIALVFGILFGIAMLGVAYVYFPLGFVMAMAGNEFIIYFMWLFAGLAVATIVLSSFARKNIMVARVGLTTTLSISAISIIYTLWQLFSLGDASADASVDMILFASIFVVCLAFGVIATVFAYLGKKKEKNAPAVENSLKQPEA